MFRTGAHPTDRALLAKGPSGSLPHQTVPVPGGPAAGQPGIAGHGEGGAEEQPGADPGECGHTDTAGVLPGGGRGVGQTECCAGDSQSSVLLPG